MAHLSFEQWKLFILDQLDEREREQYEDHLYSCDQCMNQYIAALEQSEEVLPNPNGELFSDEMLATTMQQYPQKQGTSSISLQRRTIYHYMIAAGLTIILLSAGVFQSITDYVGEVHRNALSDQRTSLTDRILEQALTTWQASELENKGGEKK